MGWFAPSRQGALRQWHVNRGKHAIDVNQPGQFCGRVELVDEGSVYVTLGLASASFGKIPRSAGIPVGPNEVHVVRSRCIAEGDITLTSLVLEYDAQGTRIGTMRVKGEEGLYYRPRAGVQRIVICLRIEGQGVVTIEDLGWRRETRIFQEVLLPAGRPSIRPNGPKVIWLHEDPMEPVAIWPNDFVRVCALDLKAGRYALEFIHRDPLVAARKGDFEARFSLSRPLDSDTNLSVLGFERGDGGELLAHPDLRSRDRGNFRTSAPFSLVEDQDWVVVELAMGIDRFLNLDSLTIRPDSGEDSEVGDNLFAPQVAQFLERIEESDAITSVLYADISMNVVDGSSIWLSSVASILAGEGRCILVSSQNIATDIIRSNIRHGERLTILTPADVGYPHDRFHVEHACAIVRRLDDHLPALRNVVVRGCAVAEELLATRQFRERAFPYLTDFYEIGEDGIHFPEDKRRQVGVAAFHATRMLAQTPQIADALEQCAGRTLDRCYLPPSIPPIEAQALARPAAAGGPVRIGYAGKINPQWGILELLDWAQRLKDGGTPVELHIATGKISDNSGHHVVDGMRARVLAGIEALGGKLHEGLNREQSMSLMAGMDYVWCWRPASLESHTLELSTKLIEMVACGARCLCFPNLINVEALGDDYPFYATTFEEFAEILRKDAPASPVLAEAVRHRFSQDRLGRHLVQECLNHPEDKPRPRILVSGHGLKFVEPYASHLKAQGHHLRRDSWQWGAPCDGDATHAALQWADVILCEWGLQNAVWHSRNRREGTRLVVRCHAQEVRQRARKITAQIVADAVDMFVFVSDRIRREAISLYGWPEEKTVVIPNFVLEDEYRFAPRQEDGVVVLGLLGMIPQSKRFDRALDLLAALGSSGIEARLHVKGQRPEQLAYMFAASRRDEMAWYATQYERIERNPQLRGKVRFDEWGNDVAQWYAGIDHILSPSDHESFHYAIADGVLAGCHPVVWQWEDADRVYPPDWCVEHTQEATARVMAFAGLDADERLRMLATNRDQMVNRYGQGVIYPKLDAVLGLGQ